MLDYGCDYVLPRPGAAPEQQHSPAYIAAPSETAFTSSFGALLPPATYLTAEHGTTAYYDFPPSAPTSISLGTPNPIPRVLLIHGVCTPALGLLPLVTALRTSRPHTHFVLYDLWGHGLSDTPRASHVPSLFHAQVRALLACLCWSDVHLVGFSFGGATAAGFAARFPEAVTSLVLLAPAGLLRETGFSERERALMRGGDGVDEGEARDWILNFLEGGELVVPSGWETRVAEGAVVAEAVRQWQRSEHNGHVPSVVAMFRDGGVVGLHADFVRAAQNVHKSLAVLGALDDICSEQDLRDVGLQNVVVIPDVGHGLVRERVPEVVESIETFWAGL